MTDSPAVRVILTLVAVALIAVVFYLVSLSSHPGIDQIRPAPESTTPPGVVTVQAQITAAHPIHEVTLSVDGGRVQAAVQAKGDRNWELHYPAIFTRGKHTALVTVVDDTGAVQRHEWTFTASGAMVPPTVAFQGPPAGAVFAAGALRIEAVVWSDEPLKTTLLTINGQPVEVKPVALPVQDGARPSYSVVLDRAFSPGAYVVQLKASDGRTDTSQGEWAFTVTSDAKQATAWYYPESQAYLFGAFKSFWEQHGGQKIFGNPVSKPFANQTGTTVQYFERARFELRPDGSVGLGMLGAESLKRDVPRVDPASKPDSKFFPETGHTLSGTFKSFWDDNGGVQIFGFPLTEVIDEDGTKVQYFERARFELVPSGNAAQPTVRLTPLGTQEWAALSASSANGKTGNP